MPTIRHYRQCHLIRHETHTYAWIPEQFARVGKYLDLKQGDIWDLSWRVLEVGSRLSEDDLRERSQDYKHTRQASDI